MVFRPTVSASAATASAIRRGTSAEDGVQWEDDAGFLTANKGPPDVYQDALEQYEEAYPGGIAPLPMAPDPVTVNGVVPMQVFPAALASSSQNSKNTASRSR